jgi:hypothetical protein
MTTDTDRILKLAEIVREADGNHRPAAAVLAEAILSHHGSRWSPAVEPEPEEPTEEELLRTYGLAKRDHCYEGPIDDWPKRAERAATVHGLRALIAADRARCGRPAVEPETNGQT